MNTNATTTSKSKALGLHLFVIAALIGLFSVLPEYHSGIIARVLILAIYAMGYNLLFGYTGLLSLGHALFFASGMYGLGLAMQYWHVSPVIGLIAGLGLAAIVSAVIGFLALRTAGVAFMIVTLMFAQAGYLTILLLGKYTRGDEGFVIKQSQRMIAGFDLTHATNRYYVSVFLFAICLLIIGWIVQSSFGKTLVAIRENEERARMLGYNVQMHKWLAVIISGTMSGGAGAAYALLFGYVGGTFATVQYSIFPLLYVLLGGAGTTVGPLIGALFMFYLIDISSQFTSAYLLVAGVALILLTLFAPQGLAGILRKRVMRWLP
ncbi:MAG: branched-chain amino acid ABC transporter permease [Granulosicoccaceae bacterium]